MTPPLVLVRNGRVSEDNYVSLTDDDEVPETGKIIVTLERWNAQQDTLRAAAELTVGVRIPNTADLAQIWPQIAHRPLIELEFPGFGDGRAYSQARLLRERYRFAGEIRATGAAVTVDQAREMSRCGINAFVLREDQRADRFVAELAGVQRVSWYQPSVPDAPASVAELRRAPHQA